MMPELVGVQSYRPVEFKEKVDWMLDRGFLKEAPAYEDYRPQQVAAALVGALRNNRIRSGRFLNQSCAGVVAPQTAAECESKTPHTHLKVVVHQLGVAINKIFTWKNWCGADLRLSFQSRI